MVEQQSGLESLLGLQPGTLQVLKMEGLWCPKAMGRAWRLQGEGGMLSRLGTSSGFTSGSTEKSLSHL